MTIENTSLFWLSVLALAGVIWHWTQVIQNWRRRRRVRLHGSVDSLGGVRFAMRLRILPERLEEVRRLFESTRPDDTLTLEIRDDFGRESVALAVHKDYRGGLELTVSIR